MGNEPHRNSLASDTRSCPRRQQKLPPLGRAFPPVDGWFGQAGLALGLEPVAVAAARDYVAVVDKGLEPRVAGPPPVAKDFAPSPQRRDCWSPAGSRARSAGRRARR